VTDTAPAGGIGSERETGPPVRGPLELPLVLPDGQPKLLLTPEEAARALEIGRTKLYKLLATAELPSVRIGGSRRVSGDALTEFVRCLTPTPGSTKVR
jgi:excisionase family DNA binding protein